MEKGLVTARGGLNLRKTPKTGNVLARPSQGLKS